MCKIFYRLQFLTLSLWTTAAFAEPEVIPAVIVKSNKMLISPSNSIKTIISQNDIARSNLKSVSQILQTFSGLQIHDTSGNDTQSAVSMRGFGTNAASNTLVLWNGAPLINPDLSTPNLNLISVSSIKSIEILSSSESVLYGDQAVGGVINIITDKAKNPETTLACSVGNFNSKECVATLNQAYKQIHYQMNLNAKNTNNYRQHSDYSQRNLTTMLGYDYANGHIDFDATVANIKMQFAGALTAAQVRENRRQAANDTDYFNHWSGLYHLKHKQLLNDDWQLETDVFRNEMHGEGFLGAPFTQLRVTNFIKSQVSGHLARLHLQTGLDLQADHYKLASSFGVTQDHQQKFNMFALSKISVSDKLTLASGFRAAKQKDQLNSFENIDTTNHALATTLGLHYKLASYADIFIKRASSFRFPKADENSDTATSRGYLKTQCGVSYESGIHFDNPYVQTTFSVYQLNLNNEIAYDPLQTPSHPFGVNTNYDLTTRNGLSLQTQLLLDDHFTLRTQYDYVNARFEQGNYAGKTIPLVAAHNVNLQLDYFFENWRMFSEWFYTGSEYPDNDNANVTNKIGGYSVFNVGFKYVYRQFTFSARINNLFNKDYYQYTIYQPSLQKNFFYPTAERNFFIDVKYVLQ